MELIIATNRGALYSRNEKQFNPIGECGSHEGALLGSPFKKDCVLWLQGLRLAESLHLQCPRICLRS